MHQVGSAPFALAFSRVTDFTAFYALQRVFGIFRYEGVVQRIAEGFIE
jgi:hypothetical protein